MGEYKCSIKQELKFLISKAEVQERRSKNFKQKVLLLKAVKLLKGALKYED
jgi:hypothetical protein